MLQMCLKNCTALQAATLASIRLSTSELFCSLTYSSIILKRNQCGESIRQMGDLLKGPRPIYDMAL